MDSESTRIRTWYLRVFQFTKLLSVFAMLHLKYEILRIFSITSENYYKIIVLEALR